MLLPRCACPALLLVLWPASFFGSSVVVSAWMTLHPTTTAPRRWTKGSSSLSSSRRLLLKAATSSSSSSSSSWFTTTTTSEASSERNVSTTDDNKAKRKAQMLQLGAALDRGQAYNPTSGDYYQERMQVAVETIQQFLQAHPNQQPTSVAAMQGEWELVLTTVKHGIFRSSPFFLAIQQSYEYAADEKEAFGEPKANLFFRLHELQTCSWGVSKIGRVAQHITADCLYSEFDTSIFSLTVIPVVGWFKLLPTFGGCVVTAAPITSYDAATGVLRMTVEYTTARPVPGLSGLGDWIWNVKVPVGAIWKLLPWNQGRAADCQVTVVYVDKDFRIVQDEAGDYFVYTRPVVPRALDLAEAAEEESK